MGGAIGQASVRGARSAGFSLIEVLVVIAVISVLAVGASLAVGRSGDSGDAARFRGAWDTQQALAVEGRAMRGLRFGPKGMQALVWRMGDNGPGWQDQGRWQRWRGRVVVSTERPVPAGEPDIVFLPGGQSSAFSVSFAADDLRCDSDGWGGLSCG